METTAIGRGLYRAETGRGTVHVARGSCLPFHAVLDCTGRTVQGAVATSAAVSCRSCRRRRHEGDAELLGVPIDG